MAVTPARTIAFEVLRRVESEAAYASDVLHAKLGANVKTDDAALATELTMGVLRWRGLLDFLLERKLKKPVARLDLPVALALRLGIYQLRFLERIPSRAAVNESVELVKRARKVSAASLVNAVLRGAATEARIPLEDFLPADLSTVERLSILHSHPSWLVERWIANLGEGATMALLEANNRTPRLSCAVQQDGHRNEILGGLAQTGLRVEPGRILKTAFAVSGGSPARTELFRSGKFSIQDEASQVIPLLLGVRAGDSVLDLCAAPGGKTPPLARAKGAEGFIVAADLHAHRLSATEAQFKRLGLADVRLIQLNATTALPFCRDFDRILVDAPCSGTGTLARHPEIRWRLRPEQLGEFYRLQTKIVASASARLSPGGRLVFSTCSLEPEENEEVVVQVLRENPFLKKVPAKDLQSLLQSYLAGNLEASTFFDKGGQFRTFPGGHGSDGFFAAVFERR